MTARTRILTKCEIVSKRSAKNISKVLSVNIAISYHPVCCGVGVNRLIRRASVGLLLIMLIRTSLWS